MSFSTFARGFRRGRCHIAESGFLGAQQFACMQRGSAILRRSAAPRSWIFDATPDFAEKGQIRFASDVFPEEPYLSSEHRARRPTIPSFAHIRRALCKRY